MFEASSERTYLFILFPSLHTIIISLLILFSGRTEAKPFPSRLIFGIQTIRRLPWAFSPDHPPPPQLGSSRLCISVLVNHMRLQDRKGSFVICCYLFIGKQTPQDGSSSKEPTCQCRRRGFSLWVGKIPVEGHGNPLQYSCMENSIDRGACWATFHRVAKSQT